MIKWEEDDESQTYGINDDHSWNLLALWFSKD